MQQLKFTQARNLEIQKQLRGAMRRASDTARLITRSQARKALFQASVTKLQLKAG